ncbi:hypothetical protein PTU84_16405 [Curtobacterium flaccumfaciens pv. poinsettiae]|nr:hypothetical protein [Curtobacterium flaccumfaciens]MDD1386611.1 hypothetical protein [Curtobacterium flaccumfaciens pv. poinsettiae]
MSTNWSSATISYAKSRISALFRWLTLSTTPQPDRLMPTSPSVPAAVDRLLAVADERQAVGPITHELVHQRDHRAGQVLRLVHDDRVVPLERHRTDRIASEQRAVRRRRRIE